MISTLSKVCSGLCFSCEREIGSRITPLVLLLYYYGGSESSIVFNCCYMAWSLLLKLFNVSAAPCGDIEVAYCYRDSLLLSCIWSSIFPFGWMVFSTGLGCCVEPRLLSAPLLFSFILCPAGGVVRELLTKISYAFSCLI